VQSVAVRLLAEREKEIQAFKSQEYWEITARLRPKKAGRGKEEFLAKLWKEDEKEVTLHTEAETEKRMALLKGSSFVVVEVNKQRRRNAPPPPFTTSQLQQQASIQLRFSTKKTMLLAQQLYEGVEMPEGPVGLITYMRTDSYHISQEALGAVRKLIKQKFGDEYLPPEPNHFPSKKGAQEAHEAIRPTYVERAPEEVKPYLTHDQYRLYELIWKRFVACQMKPALYDLTEVKIKAGNFIFRAKGRVLIFPGHTLLTGSMEEEALPELEVGEGLELLELKPSQHFTEPPPRYTEATLVKALEKRGIGRPSTYAPIISTIQERGYVRKENSTLIPTELGILVTEKLVQHFPRILDVEFTSSMEEKLDEIEEARADWVGTLKEFYNPFKGELEKAKEEMTSEKGTVEESEVSCKLCGSPMVVRWSKTGKFLGCSTYPKCEFTMPLPTDQQPVEGPPCDKCGSPMAVKSGPYGKFLGCTAYPKCKNIKPITTGVKCPQEGCDGELVQRRSKRGRRFFGCSKYPQCKYTAFKLPEKPPVQETTTGQP
jgi:DNA topoisomerase-1